MNEEIPVAAVLYDLEEGDTFNIAYELSNKVKLGYQLARQMKWLILADLCAASLFALHYFSFFFLIIFIGFGYLGAKRYNLLYIWIYLIITALTNTMRMGIFFFYYYQSKERETKMFPFIIVITCFIIELWIFKTSFFLIKVIKSLTIDELDILYELNNYKLPLFTVNDN